MESAAEPAVDDNVSIEGSVGAIMERALEKTMEEDENHSVFTSEENHTASENGDAMGECTHANTGSTSILPYIDIPDTNGEVLAIALFNVHSKFSQLPAAVNFERILYPLAIHCERYGTADLLRPFVVPWVKRMLPPTGKDAPWSWKWL